MEFGPIRPPSEATSLLLRLTRNCPWNKCRFCSSYKGERFERRSVEDIKRDITEAGQLAQQIQQLSWDNGFSGRITEEVVRLTGENLGEAAFYVSCWLYYGGENVFLQDGNSLVMSTEQLVDVLEFLRFTFPKVKRVTTYARTRTLMKKPLEDLVKLREAGLSRVHVGLESGYDPVLDYMDKGVTAADQVEAGLRVKAAGIELSSYVILGLGGRDMTREHALATSMALNAINPDFIRFRTLALKPEMPLHQDFISGKFVPLSEDGVVLEERQLIEALEGVDGYLISDHAVNLLMEVEGRLPQARTNMLNTIDRYLFLSARDRLNFRLGRRLGVYNYLSDLNNTTRRQQVDQVIEELETEEVVEEVISELRNRCL